MYSISSSVRSRDNWVDSNLLNENIHDVQIHPNLTWDCKLGHNSYFEQASFDAQRLQGTGGLDEEKFWDLTSGSERVFGNMRKVRQNAVNWHTNIFHIQLLQWCTLPVENIKL